MNDEHRGFSRKASLPISRYYSSNGLGGLWKTTKSLPEHTVPEVRLETEIF
jgi:hypothetical protein